MSVEWRSFYSVLLMLIMIFVNNTDGQSSYSSLNFLHSKQKFEVLSGAQVTFSCRVEDGSAKVFLRHKFTSDTPQYRVHVNEKVVQQGQDFLINNVGYHDNGVYYCLAVSQHGRQAMEEIAELVVINQPRHALKPEIHSLLLVCIGGLVVGFFVVCVMTILLILKQKGIIFKSLTQRLKEEAEKTAKRFKRGRKTTKTGSIWNWHEDDAVSSGTEDEVSDFNDLPFIIRHSKIKEQIKLKQGNSFGTDSTRSFPPPLPQTPRPRLKITGPAFQPSVPQTLGRSFQSPEPESLEPNGMRLAPPPPPVLQAPRPGTKVTGNQPPSIYHGSSFDDGSSVEHPYDQVPVEEVIYENIEDMNKVN